MGCFSSKPSSPGAVQSQDQLLQLQQLLQQFCSINGTQGSSSANVAQDLLDLTDEALKKLKERHAPATGSAASAVQEVYDAAEPHLQLVAELGDKVNERIKDMAAGAYPDAWGQLAKEATGQALSAGSSIAYIGPALALLGYAIKQWSAMQEVPHHALELLQGCRDLVWDLNRAWPRITMGAPADLKERLQRWLKQLAEATGASIDPEMRGAVSSYLHAQVDLTQLSTWSEKLSQVRQELATLMQQAHADEIGAVAATTTRVLNRLPSARARLEPLYGKVARPQEIQQLLPHMDPAQGGVSGVVLHGMGGIGKSTLAHQLAVELQDTGCFTGGVFKVAVLPEMTAAVDEAVLMRAQHDLLQQLSGKAETAPKSLDEGASSLAKPLQQFSSPVLLLLDNVPEGDRGIVGMLPDPLPDCLAEGSRVILTCRSSSPKGLAGLSIVAKHALQPMPDPEAKQLLRADQLQLTGDELSDVLSYCSGLPLALAVIRSALQSEADERQHMLKEIKHSISTKQPVEGMDKEHLLLDRLQFSVDLLKPELRSAWLDIAVLFSNGYYAWSKLEMVYGRDVLAELQRRSLVTHSMTAVDPSKLYERKETTVEVHHVLLTLAHRIAQPGTNEFRIGPFNAPEMLKLLTSGQVHTVAGLACGKHAQTWQVEVVAADIPVNTLRTARVVHLVGAEVDDTWLIELLSQRMENLLWLEWGIFHFSEKPPNITPGQLQRLVALRGGSLGMHQPLQDVSPLRIL